VAPFAVDVTAQSIPLSNNTSGVENLNYVIRRGNVALDLREFKKLVSFSRLHVPVDSLFFDSVPGLVEYSHRNADAIDAEVTLVRIDRSADPLLTALEEAEAVYLTPLMRLPATEFDRIISALNERRIPSFSLQGQVDVERGALAGLRRTTDFSRLARRVALNVQRILLGEDAGTLPVTLDQPEKLLINMATASAIDFHPRWRVMLEADLINEAGPWGHALGDEPLSLSRAVLEAVESNLALRAIDRGVAAGAEDVRQARAGYRPQVGVATRGLQTDSSGASFLQPERTVSGEVSASQLIYSDAVRSDIDVSRHLQRSRELERETARLDVARDAATTFLDVLRAQTLERVAQENLDLTESNLELARRREAVGASGPADVYRWEAELATDRSEVLTAHSAVHAAYVALNQTLHRPLEQLYEAEPPDVADPHLVTGTGRLGPYIDNVAGFETFREFSVCEGLANSPELRAVHALIAAEERRLTAARRSYWSPDVSVVSEVSREVSRDGEGDAGAALPGFDDPARNSWSIGVAAALPLFTGGARRSLVRQSSEELARLQTERNALAERIELRVRAALFAIASTFPSIELAQEAAQAANRNLELVTDAYSRGLVSIIELLDAQNAALVADEFASNAVYDFLVDLMELQRATGDFDFFRSEAGREAWFRRLEAFFAGAGCESLGR
jgi:outer membrane protein TolC